MPLTCGNVSAVERNEATARTVFPLVWLSHKSESMARDYLRVLHGKCLCRTLALSMGCRTTSAYASLGRMRLGPELFLQVSTPVNPASLTGTSQVDRRFTQRAFPPVRTRCQATRVGCGYSAFGRACACPRGPMPRLASVQQRQDTAARQAPRLPCPIQLGAEVLGRTTSRGSGPTTLPERRPRPPAGRVAPWRRRRRAGRRFRGRRAHRASRREGRRSRGRRR